MIQILKYLLYFDEFHYLHLVTCRFDCCIGEEGDNSLGTRYDVFFSAISDSREQIGLNFKIVVNESDSILYFLKFLGESLEGKKN